MMLHTVPWYRPAQSRQWCKADPAGGNGSDQGRTGTQLCYTSRHSMLARLLPPLLLCGRAGACSRQLLPRYIPPPAPPAPLAPHSRLASAPDCGRRGRPGRGRIRGGAEASQSELPWQVRQDNTHQVIPPCRPPCWTRQGTGRAVGPPCSAASPASSSLPRTAWSVAALNRCFLVRSPCRETVAQVRVLVGSSSLGNQSGTAQLLPVPWLAVHPGYRGLGLTWHRPAARDTTLQLPQIIYIVLVQNVCVLAEADRSAGRHRGAGGGGTAVPAQAGTPLACQQDPHCTGWSRCGLPACRARAGVW